MILVDSPNTLLVFNKRSKIETPPKPKNKRETPSKKSKKEAKKSENVGIEAEGKIAGLDQAQHV